MRKIKRKRSIDSIVYSHTIVFDGTETNISRLLDLLNTGVYFGKLDWFKLVVENYHTLSVVINTNYVFTDVYLNAFKSLAVITDVNLTIQYKTNKNSNIVILTDFLNDYVDLDTVDIVCGDFGLDDL